MNLNQVITLVANEISIAIEDLSSRGIMVGKVDAEIETLGIGMEEAAQYVRSIKVQGIKNRKAERPKQ